MSKQKRERRRKIPVIVEENESDEDGQEEIDSAAKHFGPMQTILHNAQRNETFHNKYIKEMQILYKTMDHDAFMYTFTKMMQAVLSVDESNEFADPVLSFCAKFVTSYNMEDTHPVLVSIFQFILSKLSQHPHIRYRLCQFVNMILNALGTEAALDDYICDKIMSYMINRLRDVAPVVRVQAILALQRLQIPENPDDIIVKTYQYHLSSDPSPKVRQAVISSMGRNHNTIPYILDRLWDVDEKVRRHTYLHMSSYPVKSYKVVQRLTFLEQGLNDRSEIVRKVVTRVMLPQWLEAYNKNIMSLVSGLKLDASELEIDRFRKTAKQVLLEIFKQQKDKNCLIDNLPLEAEGEFQKCLPLEEISIETTIYWLCLIEFLQKEESDELDLIIPDLSSFCKYVNKYCESSNHDMDKWKKLEHQYILLSLVEIAHTFDLGDEIGRENLKQLLVYLLENLDLEEHAVEVIARCAENLIEEQEPRFQYFVDIIKNIYEPKSRRVNETAIDRNLIEELLEKHPDQSLKLKLSTLKFKMLDLEEQEMNFVERKDYVQAQKVADERAACGEEYSNLLKPLLKDKSSSETEGSSRYSALSSQQPKKITTEAILKCLQISYHMVVSKKVKSLTPVVCELYKDFIRRHIESSHIIVRDWALQCGTAYSLLYDQLSKDVYTELYSQFYKNHNTRIWKTSIECIFELLDRYGFSHFEIEEKQNKSRKPARQLYNTLEFLDTEEDTSSSAGYGVDLIFMMSHFLDTCDDITILNSLVKGFCRLILHGHMKNDEIVEKLLIKYFNPVTDNETNQLLGVFFENLIIRKKQDILQPSLLPTISAILDAPYDSPLHEIKPETVLRFVIESTQPKCTSIGLNIHNTIALSFMQEMLNNLSNKELLKVLSRELTSLEVDRDDSSLKHDLKDCCNKLLENNLDLKTQKYIENCKDSLDGNYKHLSVSTRNIEHGSDEEHTSADEDENGNKNENQSENASSINEKQNEIGETTEKTADKEPAEDGANSLSVSAPSPVNISENDVEKNGENNLVQPEIVQPEIVETEVVQPEIVQPTIVESEPAIVEPKPVIVEPEPAIVELEPATPTTFGRENRTNLSHLRKSLSTRKRSSSELNMAPPNKTQSPDKNKQLNLSLDEIPPSPNHEIANQSRRATRLKINMATRASRRAAVEKGSKTEQKTKPKKNDTGTKIRARLSYSPKLISDEDNVSKKQNEITSSINKMKNKKGRKSSTISGESEKTTKSDSDKSEPINDKSIKKSIEKNSTPQPSKLNRISRNSLTNKSTNPVESKGENKNSGPKAIVTAVKTSDTNTEKRTEHRMDSSKAITQPQSTTNKDDKVQKQSKKKIIQNRFQVTKSVEKRITESKNPRVKVNRNELDRLRTRSAAREQFRLNNVMTRNKSSSPKKGGRLSRDGDTESPLRNSRRKL